MYILPKNCLPLMKNVRKPLTKSVLKTLVLAAETAATDATTQKENVGPGMTTLTISYEEMNDIMKIIK